MGDVIDITDILQPSNELTLKCLACKHEWVSQVHIPIPAEFECPKCSTYRGVAKYMPTEDDAEVLRCECGSIYFVITWNDGAICTSCGDSYDY